MMDKKTTAKFQESYNLAAKGYTAATGAACSTFTTALFQAWIDSLESVRPGKDPEPQPTSWYRHPDKPSLNPLENASRSAWPFTPMQWARMPIPGWWMMTPTRHPTTTWPMAYGLEASGIPKPVAWPLAEANSAAFDAYQTAMAAWREQLFAWERVASTLTDPSAQQHTHQETPRKTAETRTRQPDRPASPSLFSTPNMDSPKPDNSNEPTFASTDPMELALSWQAANAEALTAWWDGFIDNPTDPNGHKIGSKQAPKKPTY
ncbi:MAG: hypothetical protein AAFV45_11165 [Pseudomonadota bacterium]